MKKYFFILPFIFYFQFSFAQNDTLKISPDDNLENILENSVDESQSDLEESELNDFLLSLKEHPANINKLQRDVLLQIPGFNEILFANLKDYISTNEKLTSVYELQAVEGFTPEIINEILPFITVIGTSADFNPNQLHPRGPSFQDIFAHSHKEYLVRYQRVLEEQKGYTPPDTTSSGTLTSRYLGSPDKIYTKFRMSYANNLSIGFVMEKDAGENFSGNTPNHSIGFDFVSAHFFMKDFGNLNRLVVGDYELEFGQGLGFWSAFSLGKGSETINAVKKNGRGIKPYTSVDENNFLRGAAATYAIKNFYLTAFFSKNSLDATVTTIDTSTNEAEEISSLLDGGYHRTLSELEDKDVITETILGERLEFRKTRFSVGSTFYKQNFSADFSTSTKPYKYFDFTEKENSVATLDYDFVWRNMNLFAEAGRSENNGYAVLQGAVISLDPKVDVSVVARNFSPDYHCTHCNTFSERRESSYNEKGIYLGIKINPLPKWTFTGYFDQFRFNWLRYQISSPSNGSEYLALLQFQPIKTLRIYGRFRSEHKQTDSNISLSNQNVEYLTGTRLNNARLDFYWKLNRNLTLKSRMEKSSYTEDDSTTKGFLFYQDIIFSIFKDKLELTSRFALFETDNYDTRIYAYENDLLGYFSIPAYYYRGSKFYLMAQMKIFRGTDLWIRYSSLSYANKNTVGSDLDEIDGSNKSEIKMQFRIQF